MTSHSLLEISQLETAATFGSTERLLLDVPWLASFVGHDFAIASWHSFEASWRARIHITNGEIAFFRRGSACYVWKRQ